MSLKVLFKTDDSDFIEDDYQEDIRKEINLYIRFFASYVHCPNELYRLDGDQVLMLQVSDLRNVIFNYWLSDFNHFCMNEPLVKVEVSRHHRVATSL